MDTPLSLSPFLFTGERVLWSGRPKQGLLFSQRDIILIPFSLLWGGFAIFWNAMVWLHPMFGGDQSDPDWFFKLWGLPFLLVGLYLIIGRFLHDAYLRKAITYAVTDRRVLIVRGRKLTSLDIDRLPRLDYAEHRDGTGTLAFEAAAPVWGGMNGFGWWTPALGGPAQFVRISTSRTVYDIIRGQSRG